MVTPRLWLQIVMVYFITFSLRLCERAARWLFCPNDSMVLAELERLVRWPLCAEWARSDASAFHTLASFSVALHATAGAAHWQPCATDRALWRGLGACHLMRYWTVSRCMRV